MKSAVGAGPGVMGPGVMRRGAIGEIDAEL